MASKQKQEMVYTPSPSGYRLSHPEPGEEIVVSGVSGCFPDSDDVLQLRENLFNKVDLVSDDDRRWKLSHPEIPQRTGKINNVNKFDASFFGVHFKQAHTMDPMCRMLLEKTYEACIDAGINPKALRNTNTGVFVGATFSESEKTWFYEKMQVNGFGITGCSRAMFSNRISYWLGCTGPSYTVDSACSSSLLAMENAYRAIREGHCDAAIVGGCNLCLHPYVSLQFSRLGVLSSDGICKTFDNNAAGYVRAETVAVVLLQKAKDAKRAYAQILHAKTNCDGYKEEGITYPASNVQKKLMKEFYMECGIDPKQLEYVEAHGTGTRVGDPEEMKAIDEIFCTDRKGPLKIGSVKSNLGHSEPASGVTAVIKCCFAYDTGYIPPNIYYNTPKEGVPGLVEGRMVVVTEKQPWGRGLVGVNSFGFGGANVHVLLKNFSKPKINNGVPKDDLPRLVCVSGRTENAVKRFLDDLESREVDEEHVGLLHNIYKEDISGHVFKGYVVLRPKSDTVKISRDVQYFSGVRRPVWFVFSGMGSQWPGMAAKLMRIPVFAAAIEKCHKVLHPKGIDITKIITDPNPKMFDNILHSFVGIAAVQIGLCDILKSIGIEPDYIIGHSVGEVGCAYADGCLTAEEMILATYSRGLASVETPFIKGSMAAIGMGYDEIKNMCPPDIEVACHNASDSCTISGPADSMKTFIDQLQSKGVFAKEVACSNIAYHSKYIADAGPTLLKYLRQVIKEPRKRSSKWISTSVPKHLWDEKHAQYSSAEYHTNNLLSPVLFEEASKLIHPNAITIEIAPHGLLQAILRRSLKSDCINVSLAKRGHSDNVEFLLSSIGKLYEVGITAQISNLYPKIQSPVSNGTPMLSHLVEWEHSEDWYVASFHIKEKMKSGERLVRMSIVDEDMEYMAGHVVDGRNLYPATGYLVLVWETLGMMLGEMYTEFSVVFENVRFQRATNIPKEGNLEFVIMIQKGSGNFEIVESGTAIVTGQIYAKKDVSKDFRPLAEPVEETGEYIRTMTTKDFYKEMRLRGYNYTGMFRAIQSCNVEGTRGVTTWENNWVTFMDTMMQIKILGIDSRSLYVPTRIEKISIDATKHYAILSASPGDDVKPLPITVYKECDIIRCGGVEIRGLFASPISKRKPLGIPVLEKYQFVPNYPQFNMNLNDIVRIDIQITLENFYSVRVKSIELIDSETAPDSEPLMPMIKEGLGDTPLIQAELLVLSEQKLDLGANITVENKKLAGETNALLFVGSKLLNRKNVLEQAFECIKDKAFIISRESQSFDPQKRFDNIDIIAVMKTGKESLVLLRKKINPKPAKFIHIKETDDKFKWIDEVKTVMNDNMKLVLVAEKEKYNGILGLVNCLRREPGGELANCIAIFDQKAPAFDPDLPLYEEQIDKELAMNIFQNGQWGTYRFITLEETDTVNASHAYLNVGVRGDLSTLRWYQGDIDPKKDKDIAYVYYSPMNFRDIMTSTGRIAPESVARGRLAQECIQGIEFAGKRPDGSRVMGMLENKGMANIVRVDPYLLWDVPDHWSLEDAATVPITYGTVYYAMFMVGNLRPGETVLIHAGSGGVGQSAINVCLHHGCKVFTTVGTPAKRAFLKKLFPQLTDDNIGNSRDTSFEELVMKQTNGKGVDMILNSLSDDKLQASIRCLGYKGRFLEIGKFDVANNTNIGMYCLLKEISFHGIMMDFLFVTNETRQILQKHVMEGIKQGAVKPLVRVIFNENEVEKCFRYMAAGKHIGKVLIKIRDEESDKLAIPTIKTLNAIPRYMCRPEEVFVVVGGLGGFGLELIDWLVIQGARKIIINSRRGVSNGYQSYRMRTWKNYGTNIIISKDNVATQQGCVNLLKTANNYGVVRAIFNLAVILKDAIFENQNSETFKESFAPKAVATKFLDIESRKLCPHLTDFIIFSSVTCGRGNAGQTNYGMANSIMERICEDRHKSGLPALAIEWGAIGEVGLVADMQEDHFEMEIGGTLQQKITSCLSLLDQFLNQRKYPIVSSIVVAEKKTGDSGCGSIVESIASIMGIKDLKTVSMQTTLPELGMDSMMAVEIKQTLEREFEIFLTAQDIRVLTFARLMELTVQREANRSTSGGKPSEGLTGFRILIRNVGDELTSSELSIDMSTMISDKNNDEDSEDLTMFMIPGIEGMASSLEPVCKRLKCKVTALQLGYDHLQENIPMITNRLLPYVKSRISPTKRFIFLGYSYGAILALEIASVLEKEGYIGKIFCVDGSPDVLQRMARVNLAYSSESALQDTLLCHIMDLLVPKNQHNVAEALAKIDSWENKVEHVLQHVPNHVKHSKQYQRSMATIILDRVKSVLSYEPKINKLKSEIILLRTKDNPHEVNIEEDYGLQKFAEQPIKMHLLEGNHATILENKDCANIINKIILDKKPVFTKTTRSLVDTIPAPAQETI